MEEEVSLLNQLVDSLEKSVMLLEGYFKVGDLENFNRTKGFMTKIQRKITEVVNAI